MARKVNYTVDDDNRLNVRRNNKTSSARGNFSVDSKNRLIYFLNEPPRWRRAQRLDSKIVFQGNWQLDNEHNLVLAVTEINDKPDVARLVLKGNIISAEGDNLVFEIRTLNKEDHDQFYLIKLGGTWFADEHNRLSFNIKKEEGPDVITLMGAWQVDKRQQIAYTYQKTELKKKAKVSHIFTVEGFWQANSATKLTYILRHSMKSAFDFRAQVESPNLYPKEGVIKYRVGIGVREENSFKERIISLYGAWKFSRKAGLSFEMDCGRKKLETINFEAEANLSDRDKIIFILTNKKREPLGFAIRFEHKFLKKLDAEFFLRLKKSFEESRIDSGVHIPF